MNPDSSHDGKLQIVWTVDVEDYYMSPEGIPVSTWDQGLFEDRIEVGSRKLLDLFGEYRIRATWFFLGWVADKHPELVKDVSAQGHEIATHTYDHRPVHSLNPRDFQESLTRSCDALASITGEKVLGHRAPEWSLRSPMKWAFDLLAEQGLRYDSSINPVTTYLYGEKGASRHPYLLTKSPPLWEVPPAAIRFAGRTFSVGGGFFLRALPQVYMHYAISRYNREGYAAVVYIHPWELDPSHPVPSLSRKEKWIHCMGLRNVERKMRALLSESTSQTLWEYIKTLEAKGLTTGVGKV